MEEVISFPAIFSSGSEACTSTTGNRLESVACGLAIAQLRVNREQALPYLRYVLNKILAATHSKLGI